MSPDPSKIKRDVSLDPEAAEYIHPIDEEIRVDGYEQYELINENEIPANDSTDEEDEETDDEDDDNNEYTFQNAAQEEPPVPAIISAEAEIQSQIWNSPRQEDSTNIEISPATSQQITQIMSKISLPNAPAWIKEISTETLVSRLKNPK